MKVDNFALTMFQACPRKFDLRMNQGWTIRRRSPALSFGAAVHTGLAEWYRGHGVEATLKSVIEAWDRSTERPDDYRTLEKCVKTLGEYALFYPHESFTVVGAPDLPIVEQTFTLALGLHLACDTCGNSADPEDEMCPSCHAPREPIEYGGIFDTLVEFGGQVYVLEHKTTSQLGPYYFTQFKPNNQVSGYVWAARQLSGRPVHGALVNAIGIYKVGKTKFERQVTTRNDQEIAEWKVNVWATCLEIQMYRKLNVWPQRTPACTQYGLCEMHQVCSIPDHNYRDAMLEQAYVRDEWDYTNRDEAGVVAE